MASLLGFITSEVPKFQVVWQSVRGGYEVRRYPAHIRAEVDMPDGDQSRSSGFRMLAGYIFGGNQPRVGSGGSDGSSTNSGDKIAMTAPVLTQPVPQPSHQQGDRISMTAPVLQMSGSNSRMAFILPSQYQHLGQLPLPKDPRVHLAEYPSQDYAALQFSGTCDDATFTQKARELEEAVRQDADSVRIQPGAQPMLAQYNPPWTLPFLRTNEVLVAVELLV